MLIGDNNRINPAGFSLPRVARPAKLFGDTGIEELVVSTDKVITLSEIDPKTIDDLLDRVIGFVKNTKGRFSSIQFDLPLLNSGGESFSSKLEVSYFPEGYMLPNFKRIFLFLKRDDENDGKTTFWTTVDFYKYEELEHKELKDVIRAQLIITLTEGAQSLAERVSMRAAMLDELTANSFWSQN